MRLHGPCKMDGCARMSRLDRYWILDAMGRYLGYTDAYSSSDAWHLVQEGRWERIFDPFDTRQSRKPEALTKVWPSHPKNGA